MNKLDFKLINICLVSIIFYFICKTSSYWLWFINRCIDIVLPIFLGFFLAYTLNPFLEYLERYKIKRFMGVIMLIIILIMVFIVLFCFLASTYKQFLSCITYMISIIKNLSFDSSLSLKLIKFVDKSIDLLSSIVIVIVSCFYFLVDFENIKTFIKKYVYKKSKIIFNYLKIIDCELFKYIKGFLTISLISFIEYTIIYLLLSHPYALLLGILSSLSNFIPFFGGMIVQVFAVFISLGLDQTLGIKVLILTIIFGFIDAYLINPWVYGKSNKIHPLITILSVFIFGSLFGFVGIIISLPVSIVIMTGLKYFHKDELN